MKKILITSITTLLAFLGFYSVVHAAPTTTYIAATTTAGCLNVNTKGLLWSSGSACGTGSGGTSGGTWATTTSNVAGRLINYPNNNTDIVTVGSNSTTTAKFYFDPNTLTAYLVNASTTALNVSGATYLTGLSQGQLNVGAGGQLFAGASTTFSTGLTYSAGNVICNTSSNSVFGCLTASDFSRFNSATTTFSSPLVYTLGINAVTCPTCYTGSPVTAVTATWPITSSGGLTPVITWSGTATSTARVAGQLDYSTGVNTVGQVATTSVTCSGTVTCTAFTGIGASPITINGSAGTSASSTLYADNGTFTGQNQFINNSPTTIKYASSTSLTTSGMTTLGTSGSNVGVGLTIPRYQLHVQSPGDAWAYSGMFFSPADSLSGANYNTLGGNGGLGFEFYGTALNKAFETARGNFGADSTINFLNGTGDSASISRLFIDANGLVGLGSTTPRSKLSVQGSALFSGNLSAANITATGTVNLTALSQGQLSVGASGLLYSGASTTFSGALTYSAGAVTCNTASASVFGCLTAASFSKFNSATTTAGTGLTYSGNAFNVNTSQNISTLSNLTSNGFVKTSGGTGTLSIDTATYLTATSTLTNNNTFSGVNSFTNVASTSFAGALSFTYASSTATSTFAGINLPYGGCVAIAGVCLTNNAGTVTSVATNQGLTGGTITNSGTIGLDLTGVTANNTVLTWNGTRLTATGTNSLAADRFIATSTATSTFAGGIDALRFCITGTATCLNGTAASSTLLADNNTFSGILNYFTRMLGFGTTTVRNAQVTIASSTAPQLNLSSGAGVNQWALRNDNVGNLTFSTTTVDGTATTTTAAMQLNTGGSAGLGIGTTTPFGALTLEQGTETSSVWIANQGSSTPSLTINGVNGNGNVGIGTSSPWRILSVSGSVAFSGLTTAAGTPSSLCMNAVSSEVTVNAALTCTVSSRDYKQNIVEMASLDGLDFLKLNPVSFEYKDKPERERWGFIAEEVAAIDVKLGDAYDKDGTSRSLDQNGILAVTVKFVQGFYTDFQKLVARISGLENKLDSQQKQIDALNTRLNKAGI